MLPLYVILILIGAKTSNLVDRYEIEALALEKDGVAHQKPDKIQEGLVLRERVFAIIEEHEGRDSMHLLPCLRRITGILEYQGQGRSDEAMKRVDHGLAILEILFGPSSQHVAAALTHIANASGSIAPTVDVFWSSSTQEERADLEPLFASLMQPGSAEAKKALSYSNSFRQMGEHYAAFLERKANDLVEKDLYAEAISCLERFIPLSLIVFGECSDEYFMALANMATCKHQMNIVR